jgi:translation initiation factor 4G
MTDIPITSYEILTKMIYNVYEKAIGEPSFGEIYADLCTRLSLKAKENPFLKIIESDEEPPTEDGEVQEGGGAPSSHNIVYRWSNDVPTDDAEIIGPFETVEDCLEAAIDADNCPEPQKREKEMTLHSVKIHAGQFVKILHDEETSDEFYTVFFPASKAEEVGQQMSNIFLSEIECRKHGAKSNSFKGILLNKCQDEFNKKNIYDAFKVEKAEFEKTKKTLSEPERRAETAELEFRRMKIKKQVLGNIQFIGELFKKGMLRVKVMRDCIETLMNFTQKKDGEGKLTGDLVSTDEEMDEEDHEAVCKLFGTIGSTIDQTKVRAYIDMYFTRILTLSDDNRLSARSRFLYKDLIDLRRNRWKERREKETAKTLAEITEDFEREERKKEMESQQQNQGYRGNRDNRRGGQQNRGDNRGGQQNRGDYRNDSRDNRDNRRDQYPSKTHNRPMKERVEPKIDKDGFTEVATGTTSTGRFGSTPKILSRDSKSSSSRDNKSSRTGSGSAPRQQQQRQKPVEPTPPPKSGPEPMSEDKLKLRAKNMSSEFMEHKNKDELLLSMDDLKATPNAGKVIVQTSVDKALDCKDAEREAIISVLSILYTNGKLTADDVSGPFGEIVEFIDSFVVDSPRAVEYMGDLMAEFLHIKALDVNWLCTEAKKLEEFSAHLIPGVIEGCVKSSVSRFSADEAKAHFGGATDALTKLLGAEKWTEIESKCGLK